MNKNVVIALLVIIILILGYTAINPGKNSSIDPDSQESTSNTLTTNTQQTPPPVNNQNASTLKTTTNISTVLGKTVTFSFSNDLTAKKMRPEEDQSLIALVDNTNHLRMSVYEIPGSEIVEERNKYTNYSSLGLQYLGEQKFNGYTVRGFLNVGNPPNPNAKQKIWFLDFGTYGFSVTDDSEGKYSIDWSSFKVK